MNLFALTSFICGLSSFGLAVFALVVGKSKPQKLFMAFNVAVAIWGFGNFAAGIAKTQDTALLAWRYAYFGGFFISTFFYHMTQAFFDIRRRKLLIAAYLHSFFFAASVVFFPGQIINRTRIAFGIHYNVITVFTVGAIVAFLLIVGLSYAELLIYLRRAEGKSKTQAKYFIGGFAFGFFGGATTLLPLFGIDIIYPAGNLGIAVYVFVLLYAIFRHQVLDIRIIIKRTLFYSLFVLALSLFYVLIVFAIHQLMFAGSRGGQDLQGLLGTFGLYSIPSFIGTIVFLLLGFAVLFHRPQTKEKVLFSILCFETFFWEFVWFYSFYCPTERLTYIAKVAYLTITFVPFTFYHFIVEYLKEKKERKYVIFFYVVAFILIALIFPTDWYIKGNRQHAWGNFSYPGFLYPVFVAAALFSMIKGLSVIRRFQINNGENQNLQNQIKYFFLAFGLYFFCTLDFLQVYGASWYPIGTIFFLLSFLVIAYAILKHHLLDIQVVIKRTLFYSGLTISISLIYLSLVFLFYSAFLRKAGTASFLANALGILFIAITFKPVELIIHRLLEKKFFKGSIVEISEQKAKLESELERRERLKSVGILAAGMAHEIKNPITAIQTFAEYLPKKYDDPEFREKFCRIVNQETARIADIVRDLLIFSKPLEPQKREFDAFHLLKDIVELLSGDLLKNRIQVEWETGDGEGAHEGRPYIFADTEQIKQVFLNIIMNAIDAMKGERRGLTISMETHDKFVHIAIRDTGCGIPQDKIPHLFDPFFTDKEGGTGLGLAVAYSIMEKNNGKISVESEAAKGTAFTVQLPIAP